MNFNEELKQRVEQINALLAAKLPAEEGMQQRVAEAMNYSVNAGGKRLRPMLLLEVYRLLGGTDEKIMEPFMAALECIHTYSLVHDDLPAMDNDDYRRGKLTTHKKFGEDFGVLAGDGLLNYAYELVFNGISEVTEPDDLIRCVKAAKVIAYLTYVRKKSAFLKRTKMPTARTMTAAATITHRKTFASASLAKDVHTSS